MNQNDINRAFTEKLTELLGRGYQIHPGTMGGSQGEIAHVDLYRGDEIIRVLLDHSAGRGEKPDGVRLVVGRNTDRIRMLAGMESACKAAMNQIKEKHYDERLRNEGRENITAFGISFCKKRCKVIFEKL